jgi:hypothetical protein
MKNPFSPPCRALLICSNVTEWRRHPYWVKGVVAYPIPMGAPALPGAPIHGAPENTVLISNKKGSESSWTHVRALKRTPHVPSTGYSLIHSWWESNPGGCVQET